MVAGFQNENTSRQSQALAGTIENILSPTATASFYLCDDDDDVDGDVSDIFMAHFGLKIGSGFCFDVGLLIHSKHLP